MGLREEPWGTPQLISVGSEWNRDSLTGCVGLVRKEWIQSSALLWMLASWSLMITVQWETVSKAGERSSRMSAVVSPWSRREQMSSVAAKSAVLHKSPAFTKTKQELAPSPTSHPKDGTPSPSTSRPPLHFSRSARS